MKCPVCSTERFPAMPICSGCWWTLQPAARAALKRQDDNAEQRRQQLLEQLADGIPLHKIVITDPATKPSERTP